MKSTAFSNNGYAVSEVVGATILVLIAVGAFAAIYSQVFPVKLPGPEPHVQLAGYVTDTGRVVLEHIGGEELVDYRIIVEQSDGPHTYSFNNDPWEIGECYYPTLNSTLFDEEKQVKITVYDVMRDGSTFVVFDGIITPNDHAPGPTPSPLPDPMFLSTLRTNTSDEDLICYGITIHPNIVPITFVYNWMRATTGPYIPFASLLLPFDTQQPFMTKDYSGKN